MMMMMMMIKMIVMMMIKMIKMIMMMMMMMMMRREHSQAEAGSQPKVLGKFRFMLGMTFRDRSTETELEANPNNNLMMRRAGVSLVIIHPLWLVKHH